LQPRSLVIVARTLVVSHLHPTKPVTRSSNRLLRCTAPSR